MNRLGSLLVAVSLACSNGTPRTLELTIRKTEGVVTAVDLGRLERRVLGVQGVTLVSVSASRESLLIHHREDTDMVQLRAALQEMGFRWVETGD